MDEIVPLTFEEHHQDVLKDFAKFHGRDVPFRLDDINRIREEYGKSKILPQVAMYALLTGAHRLDADDLTQLLVDFFGEDGVQPSLSEVTGAMSPIDLDALDGVFLSKLKDLCSSSVEGDGPVGPSLCCLYDSYALGIYMYARVIFARKCL